MGLDQNLYRKIYVKNWEHKEEKNEVILNGEIKDKAVYIIDDAGYWRKANAIHRWFVENVQDGEDNCGEYKVERKQLEELLDRVNQVLAKSKMVKGKVVNGQIIKDGKMEDILEEGEFIEDNILAQKLLPTTSGFFFGGTNYDQYYIDDLKHTKEIIEECLKDKEDFNVSYYYSSSW